MSTVDRHGALHDAQGLYANQNKPAAGYDLTPVTAAPSATPTRVVTRREHGDPHVGDLEITRTTGGKRRVTEQVRLDPNCVTPKGCPADEQRAFVDQNRQAITDFFAERYRATTHFDRPGSFMEVDFTADLDEDLDEDWLLDDFKAQTESGTLHEQMVRSRRGEEPAPLNWRIQEHVARTDLLADISASICEQTPGWRERVAADNPLARPDWRLIPTEPEPNTTSPFTLALGHRKARVRDLTRHYAEGMPVRVCHADSTPMTVLLVAPSGDSLPTREQDKFLHHLGARILSLSHSREQQRGAATAYLADVLARYAARRAEDGL